MVVDPPNDMRDTSPLATLVGRRVGPYLLESEIGRGGMGSVWCARRADGQYEAQVAIKLLAAAWAGQDGEVRFRHEGKLLARLDHPNIARLLDAGVTEQTEPYLVIEYVEGERIDEHCRKQGLSIRARIELFLEVASAVAHAHRNLVVHRDIKPANVLVTRHGKAKLLDFGIGKLVEGDVPLTRSGHTLLTPEYAAPEQLLGAPVTTATDIYALGLLLYVLLTEQLPYRDAAASPAELIRRITTGAVPLPSSVAMTQVRGNAPPVAHQALQRELRGDLDNIVLKAMQPAPEQRYEDVNALIADLRRFLNHEPVSARASSAWYRFGKFVRRNRAAVIAGVAVLLAVTIGSVISITQTLEARRQRAAADEQELVVELFDDIVNLILFSEGGPDGPAASRESRLDRAGAMVEQRYAKNPGFAGRMLLQLAEHISDVGSTAVPTSLVERAYALGRKANDTDLMISANCNLARHLLGAGMTEQASQRMQQAQQMLATHQPDSSIQVECLAARALFELASGKREAAAQLMRDAIREMEQSGLAPQGNYTTLLTLLTSVYVEQGKFAQALALTDRAARLEREIGYADTSLQLVSSQNRAALLLSMGEVSAALAERTRVNEAVRKFHTPEETPFQYAFNYAAVLLRMERAPEALAVLAADLDRARHADNPGMLLQMLQFQAAAHLRLRQWDAAEALLREAQPLVAQGAGSAHVNSQVEMHHANLALGRNDLASARQHIEVALQLAGYGTAEPQRTLTRVLLAASTIALAQGRSADAEKYSVEALRISQSVSRGPESSADVGESLLMLAKSRAAAAQPGSQRSLLELAVACLSSGLAADHPLTREARELLVNPQD